MKRTDKQRDAFMTDVFASISEDGLQEMRNMLAIVARTLDVMDDLNISQKELAERLGKSESEVSKWLSGMHNLTLRSVAKLEVALGTKILFPGHVSTIEEELPKSTPRKAGMNESYDTGRMQVVHVRSNVSVKDSTKQIIAA